MSFKQFIQSVSLLYFIVLRVNKNSKKYLSTSIKHISYSNKIGFKLIF